MLKWEDWNRFKKIIHRHLVSLWKPVRVGGLAGTRHPQATVNPEMRLYFMIDGEICKLLWNPWNLQLPTGNVFCSRLRPFARHSILSFYFMGEILILYNLQTRRYCLCTFLKHPLCFAVNLNLTHKYHWQHITM